VKPQFDAKVVTVVDPQSEIYAEVRFGEPRKECVSFGRYHQFDDEKRFAGHVYVYVRFAGQEWNGTDVIRHCRLEPDRLIVGFDEHSKTWSNDLVRLSTSGPSDVEVSFLLPHERFLEIQTQLRQMFGEFDWYDDRHKP
jgi:hypothetical protein